MTPSRTIAYRITMDNNQPLIQYAGIVSPDIVLEPQLAVQALRIYQFPETFVRITDRSADQVRTLWNTIEDL